METLTPECLDLKTRLNLETAQIEWQALQRFFAAGQLLWVAPSEDLVAVGASIAEDQVEKVKSLQNSEKLLPVDDATALRWAGSNPSLWALVVKPFILVQEPTTPDSPPPELSN